MKKKKRYKKFYCCKEKFNLEKSKLNFLNIFSMTSEKNKEKVKAFL